MTEQDILAIKTEKIFHDKMKVKRVGEGLFQIIGFHYGEEEIRFTGYAAEVKSWMNGYLGLPDHNRMEVL